MTRSSLKKINKLNARRTLCMAIGLLTLILLMTPFQKTNGSRFSGGGQAGQTGQVAKKLTLKQLEDLLRSKSGITDEDIARLIREYGIDFRLNDSTLERLKKLGLGEQAKNELLQREERAAFDEYQSEKRDPAKKAALGREFLRKYPDSPLSKEVTGDLPRAVLERFNSDFNAYSRQPDKAKLDRLLAAGNELLGSQDERWLITQVSVRLALAKGLGMIRGFYTDLDQSRVSADRALKLLEDSLPPGVDPAEHEKFRASSLSALNQYKGLYLLRQEAPDPEGAIDLLSKAIESKDGPSAADPNTYWLRVLANDLIYQKRLGEYQALSKTGRRSSKGQSLCAMINPQVNRMVDDITQVLLLSSATGDGQLRAQADAKLKSFLSTDRPCLSGKTELIDELPESKDRYALIVGVEDYIDKQVDKFHFAASDARALSDALVRNAGFKQENIVLIATGNPGDRQPLRSVILQQLIDLNRRVPADGLMLVFFAAHCAEREGRGYLLPSDALVGNDLLLDETAIRVDRVRDLLASAEAEQVIFMIDAFRQNALSDAFIRNAAFDLKKGELSAHATIFSTGVGDRSYQSQTKKMGHFTRGLVETFKGPGANNGSEVTLDELVKTAQTTVQRNVNAEIGENARQKPHALIEGYEADDLVIAITDAAVASRARSTKVDPADLLRASKTIFVNSNTIYLKSKTLEDDLLKLPEFKELGLQLVRNEKEADLIVDVNLPFLTWNWIYNLRHPKSGASIAGGSVRELAGGGASIKLARELTSAIQRTRSTKQ